MKRLIVLALPALFAWACTDVGAGPPEDQLDNHVVSTNPLATETVALSFYAQDTMTACGEATGIRVTIAAEGETLSCIAGWAPAMVSDPYTGEEDMGRHFVADCFFVVAPGTWDVLTVEPIDGNGEALPCCTAEYPETVAVISGQTTEFGVEIQCPLVGPGAIDIYGYLERPPIIKALDIYPSKFGAPCVPRFLFAVAEDREGDEIEYSWDVVTSPENAYYKVWEHGQMAVFVGFTPGDYMLRLTVTDQPHGMFTSLEFPIHVTEPAFPHAVMTQGSCLEAEPALPTDFQ